MLYYIHLFLNKFISLYIECLYLIKLHIKPIKKNKYFDDCLFVKTF